MRCVRCRHVQQRHRVCHLPTGQVLELVGWCRRLHVVCRRSVYGDRHRVQPLRNRAVQQRVSCFLCHVWQRHVNKCCRLCCVHRMFSGEVLVPWRSLCQLCVGSVRILHWGGHLSTVWRGQHQRRQRSDVFGAVPWWSVLPSRHWVHGVQCWHVLGCGCVELPGVRCWHVIRGECVRLYSLQHWPVLDSRLVVLELQRGSVRKRNRHVNMLAVFAGERRRDRSRELYRVCTWAICRQLVVIRLCCLCGG